VLCFRLLELSLSPAQSRQLVVLVEGVASADHTRCFRTQSHYPVVRAGSGGSVPYSSPRESLWVKAVRSGLCM
jgi:hypothetical protein